ncbi:DUF4159 domain-containing protein [Azospirillum sp. RWY-5-1]|uniref:DUF4159 domain-containing protein n=1 Tax=Azospirillum oleiclasticum TaxID=2735135 RepID=A0ABX2T6U8_9PROT|nr:DUF4159 domain-containing protein [Azospirillum oleiclasticum]NYZ11837.1 DUF4159 domain-containing protein [Azospirillum oleiclasticum]NYZ18997.1 DUF4159 domain-containing protein [Azospirillum oleiclasticum]
MLGFGAIAFATPWVLAALAVLPVLWWLLRVTPPAPRVVRFPAIRLLRDLVAREETPARTPWWLLLLRLVIAALVILALAGPLLNPRAAMPGGGPVVLVVDNGWAAGRDWPARRQAMEDAVAQAGREGRPVIVITTAHPPGGEKIAATAALPAPEAQRIVQALTPLPWPADRAAALEAVRGLPPGGSTHAVWISDGIGDRTARDLALALQRLGSAEVLDDLAARPAHLLLPPASEGTAFVARIVRADASRPEPVTVRLTAGDGRLLTRQTIAFDAGQKAREVRLEVPAELRNEAAALRVENDTTAGATVLLDERWRRRPVGLVSGRPEGENQPLLSDLHYLNRALEPYNEVRQGAIGDLLKRDLAVLILSDVGSLTGEEAGAVETWVRRGGVLLRFAGPRLAQNADTLVPVRLRIGDRALGGALSWSEPARLQPFDAKSPFAGLRIPQDVTVQRQVLAEPSLDLADRTWARLADGTPLVTAEARGDGHIVLVHTTASPDWSNLPLSGLFVDMLRRMVALSEGVAGPGQAVSLEPLEVLDGFGRLIPPPPTAFPIAGDAFRGETIGPRHPPGFYGTDEARRALNLTSALTTVDPLGALPPGVARSVYGQRGEVALKPHLLGTAMALAIIDLLIALALRGLLGRWARPRRAAAAGLLLVAAGALSGVPSPVRADDGFGLKATAETYLAFVRTGDTVLDNTVKSGLDSLVEVLNRRTAVEAAGSMGVDVERDELAFFPLLYWAVSPSHPPLTDRARTKLNDYMRHGGVILFDTRDQGAGYGGGGMALRQLTEGLDVPALGRVNPEHVLTKSFYLLQDFPGRYAGSELWVEAREGRLNDGVSSVIIGGNDWASAWATDRNGQPLYAVVPGGERQREMAFRFGVNVVMYALTGNYKADQVHVPAILERLGQ